MTDDQKIVILQEIVITQDNYLKFLNEANETPIRIASNHGWECSQEDWDKGNAYRLRIDELKSKLNNQ